ncbi:hypothetical protein [Microcoleus sp. D2_18a_B4]|uniref:hypothetical protein n=1 Tax=Microcoleus sp. D2_18a_B4 TaxID=3055329 RepID=UPI002FD3C5A4
MPCHIVSGCIGIIKSSQQSTVNSQQSTINSQQSTVNSQQSTVNNQQSTVNHHSGVTGIDISAVKNPVSHRNLSKNQKYPQKPSFSLQGWVKPLDAAKVL